jgi:hypothetical protein
LFIVFPYGSAFAQTATADVVKGYVGDAAEEIV